MDNVIRATAELVEKAETTSENLSEEAKGMHKLMETFKIDRSDLENTIDAITYW